MYSDAKNEVNFIDAEDAGVIDTSHVLNFFRMTSLFKMRPVRELWPCSIFTIITGFCYCQA